MLESDSNSLYLLSPELEIAYNAFFLPRLYVKPNTGLTENLSIEGMLYDKTGTILYLIQKEMKTARLESNFKQIDFPVRQLMDGSSL